MHCSVIPIFVKQPSCSWKLGLIFLIVALWDIVESLQ